MKGLILASLVVIATAQIDNSWEAFLNLVRNPVAPIRDRDQNVIDNLHEYRVEQHITDTDHLLIFIDDSREHRICYFLKVGASWEPLLKDPVQVHRITEEIYRIILDPAHVQKEIDSTSDVIFMFGDSEGARECRQHDRYLIRYSPTATAP